MQILINNTPQVIPSALSEMTLGQRVDYHHTHGQRLEQWAGRIALLEDDFEKELQTVELNIAAMLAGISFFTGISVEELEQGADLDELARVYYACLSTLLTEEEAQELQLSHEWGGSFWEIHPPEIKDGSKMSFGELIDSKQIVQDMNDLGKGRWEALLRLCCIYLRKEGEPYSRKLAEDGGERMQMMRGLPMSIALHVSLFFCDSMNIWAKYSPYSNQAALNPAADTPETITSSGGG